MTASLADPVSCLQQHLHHDRLPLGLLQPSRRRVLLFGCQPRRCGSTLSPTDPAGTRSQCGRQQTAPLPRRQVPLCPPVLHPWLQQRVAGLAAAPARLAGDTVRPVRPERSQQSSTEPTVVDIIFSEIFVKNPASLQSTQLCTVCRVPTASISGAV